MNNAQLRNLRRQLINISHKPYSELSEDSIKDERKASGLLEILERSKSATESQFARKLLDHIPKEEAQVVQDFQAVYRVIDRELWVDDEYSAGTARPNLERKANELRVEASDIIRERIKQKEIDDDTIELFDPVSKLRTHIKPVDGHDNWVEMHKEQMIERILYEA